jgi:hypothetical protein
MAGVTAAIDGIILLRDSKALNWEPMGQSLTGSFAWDFLGLSAISFLGAVFFMIARPYRPDLDESDGTRVKAQRRSWWTGEPRCH